MATTEEIIRQQLRDHAVLLYMKGTPALPKCGFSARAVAAIQRVGVPFASVDVLANPFIREKLPAISQWPTFPQLFVKGELVGGSDIVIELSQSGALSKLLEGAASGDAP